MNFLFPSFYWAFHTSLSKTWLTNIAEGAGTGVWETAYGKARRFVASLTDEEKVNLTAGVEPSNGCVGVIPPLPRVGFPGLCLSDAGNGLVSFKELVIVAIISC